MKQIGIITAMQEEADIIINKYSLTKIDSSGMIQGYVGVHKNIKLVLILSGIGKIQASIATSHLLSNYDLDNLINIGIAGNISDHGKIGDVFIINSCCQHDMYLPFDGAHLDYAKKPIELQSKYLQILSGHNFNIHTGVCATGDQFIDDKNILLEIKSHTGADVVEMEAFSILSTAREYGLLDKCIVIKAISDGADNDSVSDHMDNLNFAMNNSIQVLDKLI